MKEPCRSIFLRVDVKQEYLYRYSTIPLNKFYKILGFDQMEYLWSVLPSSLFFHMLMILQISVSTRCSTGKYSMYLGACETSDELADTHLYKIRQDYFFCGLRHPTPPLENCQKFEYVNKLTSKPDLSFLQAESLQCKSRRFSFLIEVAVQNGVSHSVVEVPKEQ